MQAGGCLSLNGFSQNKKIMKFTSKTENLIVQNLNDEVLIFDTKANKFYSLNETSAFVWNKLNGKSEIADISLQLSKQFNKPASEDIVWLAIDELRKADLVKEENLPKALNRLERRELLKKVGLASMIALPVVSSLVAPTAAHANSSCVNPGGASNGTIVQASRAAGNYTASFRSQCCSNRYRGDMACSPANPSLPDCRQATCCTTSVPGATCVA